MSEANYRQMSNVAICAGECAKAETETTRKAILKRANDVHFLFLLLFWSYIFFLEM